MGCREGSWRTATLQTLPVTYCQLSIDAVRKTLARRRRADAPFRLQPRGDLRGRVPDCCSETALVHVEIRVTDILRSFDCLVHVPKLPRSDQRPALPPPRAAGPESAKAK